MKRFFSAFTRNWWLKLFALALALTVYYAMRDGARRAGDSHARGALPIMPDPEPPPAPAPAPLIEPLAPQTPKLRSVPATPAPNAKTKGSRNGRKAK